MSGDVIDGEFDRNRKPWPENQWPTAEQFADWYVEQPREERVRLAEWIIYEGQRAAQCFLMQHEGRIEQAEAALRELYAQAASASADEQVTQ